MNVVTINNLGNCTAQEVFDYIAIHLLMQRKRSITGINCAYRVGVLKCAAGCLIPDDVFSMKFVNYNYCDWRQLIKLELVPSTHYNLIAQMQIIHDIYEVWEWWGLISDYGERMNFSMDNLKGLDKC